MTNRFLFLFAAMAIPLLSCEREPSDESETQIVITTGFEDQMPSVNPSGTKTYVAGGSEIRWSTSTVDKRIFVFDTKGGKSTFTSSSTTSERVRTFSGSITAGSSVKYVLWHGQTDNSKLTESAGGSGTESMSEGGSAVLDTKAALVSPSSVISGSCLTLSSNQTVTNTNSFAGDANISVMKGGEECLKSVFGYLRYRIPLSALESDNTDALKSAGGVATIKSIKITADEDIAGQVEIDYNGDDPVTRIVSGGSKSITVTTRWQTRSPAHYEPGLYYAVLPVGTYHNVSIEITPFANGATSQNAATATPFTIYCRGEVVVERGKYTDLGTLPLQRPTSSNPGFKFDTDYFDTYIDSSTGVVSYRIKSESIGWDNSQSVYFSGSDMTNDERFICFMVSANEFRPSYHSPQKYERSAKILDLDTRKLYTFYAGDGCYPYLDPKNDVLYYAIRSDDKTTAKFYKRELLTAPDVEVPLADFPQEIVPPGGTIARVCSHITLTQDRRKVFLDSHIGDSFYQGLLDLYTGEWTEWAHNDNQMHLTHGQINPTRDDEALLALDAWTDSQGVTHSMKEVGYANDGAYDGQGTYMRMWLMKPDGSMTLISPAPVSNYATHEGWHPDGNHIYWCAGYTNDKGGGGFHIRNIRTGNVESTPVSRSTHCNFSYNKKYVVHDDDTRWGSYTDSSYRGGPWRVWFCNRETGNDIAIYSGLPPITDRAHESRIHPDPHPHFVANDKYVVCTAAGDDGNLHFSITPVDQLINLSK